MLQDEKCRRVAEARRHIVETILTLKCPNPNGCGSAFVDFSNCFALTCHACAGEFCGWCLQYCGADAHAHVRACQHSLNRGDVFSTVEHFEESNRRRRRAALMAYLPSLGEELAGDVVTSMVVDLNELRLADVINHFVR